MALPSDLPSFFSQVAARMTAHGDKYVPDAAPLTTVHLVVKKPPEVPDRVEYREEEFILEKRRFAVLLGDGLTVANAPEGTKRTITDALWEMTSQFAGEIFLLLNCLYSEVFTFRIVPIGSSRKQVSVEFIRDIQGYSVLVVVEVALYACGIKRPHPLTLP